MKRFMFALGVAAAVAVVATPAEAQFKFGVHGAVITSGYGEVADIANGDLDFSGDIGAGARLLFTPPVLPIGVYGSLTYYFPSCTNTDCNYWTGSLGGQLGIPLPIVRPYVMGGWMFKRYGAEGVDSETEGNPFFGLGVQLNVLQGIFLEGAWEFDGTQTIGTSLQEYKTTPFVLKAGILFGD